MSCSNKKKSEWKPSEDIGWKFGTITRNRHTIMCNLCNKQISGGITRLKEHLAHKKGNVAGCLQVPSDVKQDMMKLLMDLESKKKAKMKRSCKLGREFNRMSTSNCDKDDDELLGHQAYDGSCSKRKSSEDCQSVQHQQVLFWTPRFDVPAGPCSVMMSDVPQTVSKEVACIQSEPFFPTYPLNVVEYVSSSGVFSTKPIKYPEQVPSFSIPDTFKNWKEALEDCFLKISGLKEMLRQAWEDIKCLTKERDIYKAETYELKAKMKKLELLSNLVSGNSAPPVSTTTPSQVDIPSGGCGSSERLRPNPLVPQCIDTEKRTSEEEEQLILLKSQGKKNTKRGRKKKNRVEAEKGQEGEDRKGVEKGEKEPIEEDQKYGEEDGVDVINFVDGEEEPREREKELENDEVEEVEKDGEEGEEEDGGEKEQLAAELRSKRFEDRPALRKKRHR